MPSRTSFETMARFGYAARGAVYFFVAMLALFSGFAGGGEPSAKGALASLLGEPFGRIILGVIAAGLIAFVIWRLVQAIGNADHQKGDAKGFLSRAGQLVSGLTYGALAIAAAQMAAGSGSSGGDDQKGMVDSVLALPFGNILLGLAGLVIVIAGGGQIFNGVSGKFKKRLALPPARERVLTPIGTYGLAARGLVFAIIGGFLVYAAFTYDPGKAGTVPEALDWVRSLPFGGALYMLVAGGLLAYAAYGFMQARYGRVNVPSVGEMKRVAAGA